MSSNANVAYLTFLSLHRRPYIIIYITSIFLKEREEKLKDLQRHGFYLSNKEIVMLCVII